jgi:septum formation inhibitor-activating ATPase MinD
MKKKTINDAVIKKKIVDEVKLVKSQDRGDKKDQINQEQVQKTVDENIAKSDQSSSMERKISRIKKGKSGAKKYKNELGLML